tara:strand:+ start:753 stop:1055 length:303 start_codon:yes stop_codon:yes gene_type:complete
MSANKKMNELREVANNIILNVGDMVIDHISNFRGFLTKRIRHIDMVKDDIFLWEVKLFKTNENTNNQPITILEEEGLKMSIAIGTVELHSAIKEKTRNEI